MDEELRKRMAAQAVGGMGPNIEDVHMDNVYHEALMDNSSPVEEMSGSESSSGSNMAAAQQAMGAIESAQAGKSKATTAGQATMAAGTATGNPYIMAAGLGLSAVGAISDKKAQEKQEKMKNTQAALANLQAMGANFRL